MGKQVVLSLLLLTVMDLTAQVDKNVEAGLFKVNALLPGISYELGAGENTTFNFDFVIGFALNGGSDRDTEFGLFPGVGAEFRNYYNMDRRVEKGKNISGNSGNYFGVLNQFYFGDPVVGDLTYSSEYYYNLGAVYGFQRTYKKGFYFSIAFGPALFVDDFDTDAGIIIDAKLGWVLSGRNKK